MKVENRYKIAHDLKNELAELIRFSEEEAHKVPGCVNTAIIERMGTIKAALKAL